MSRILIICICLTSVGVTLCQAPELHIGGPLSEAADWWSFGAVLYEMSFGMAPFYHPSLSKLKKMKMDPAALFFPEAIQISSSLKDMIKRLLAPDPRDRLGWKEGFQEIRCHSWFLYDSNGNSLGNIEWAELADPANRVLLKSDGDDSFVINLISKQEEALCRILPVTVVLEKKMLQDIAKQEENVGIKQSIGNQISRKPKITKAGSFSNQLELIATNPDLAHILNELNVV